MSRELTDICYSHKHHAASTHADAQSVSEWQSPSPPGRREETGMKKRRQKELKVQGINKLVKYREYEAAYVRHYTSCNIQN